jgi:hypothetical protein
VGDKVEVIRAYQFSRREIARHKCNDCGVNVIEAGDYCMLQPAIWEKQFGLGWKDNLCLACIEARLGRGLGWLDVISFPCVEGYPMSDEMVSRFHPPARKPRKKPRKTA